MPNNSEVIQYLLSQCKVQVSIKDSAQIKGRACLNFDIFEIKGFMIRFNEGKLWVNPPSIKAAYGKWLKIFWTKYEAEFWEPLCQKILMEYHRINNSEYIENIETDNSVNIDSIQF